MGDMGDLFNGLKKHSQEKRANNRKSSAKILQDNGISFESKNADAHLIVNCINTKIDFWPGTGLWICRSPHKTGRGVHGLIKYIKLQEQQ